jgi:hypothetical protein
MGGQLVGDGPHGVVALGRDAADVYGQDPAGVAQHDLVVDLRVALRRLLDQLLAAAGIDRGLPADSSASAVITCSSPTSATRRLGS